MITIENLCKAYNDKILFKNFHWEIPDSRFLVISVESWCGKSTLLNMIGGIETPDKGSIIAVSYTHLIYAGCAERRNPDMAIFHYTVKIVGRSKGK